MGNGTAAVVATKRKRRMTPLERTRTLPSGWTAPVGAAYVVVSTAVAGVDGEAATPPVDLADEGLIASRARARFTAAVYELAAWLTVREVPPVLVMLLPAFCEVWGLVLGMNGDDFLDTLEAWWDECVDHRQHHRPDPFAVACEQAEALGLSHPDQDLPTELVDVEVELYALTGAWDLGLDDDSLIDLLNKVEGCVAAFRCATGLPFVTFPTE